MNKRVLTPAQIDAARRNGAKSHGPASQEGKARSSRNSFRHGLLANSIVIPGESRDRFMTLCADLDLHFQPASEVESGLIDTMAVCRWRQMRLWSMEKAALTNEIRKRSTAPEANDEDNPTRTALAFHALCDSSRATEVLSRYETRFDRQYNRALQTLNQIRRKTGISKVA